MYATQCKEVDIIITKMRDLTACEAGTLYVVREDRLHFTIMQNEPLGTFSKGDEITLPPVALKADNIENVSAYCALHNETVNIDDVYEAMLDYTVPDKVTGKIMVRMKS